jgi:LmbE family N-acetylglucosaminyl deacetylase
MNIMAFGPHPDDVEITCAGTLAKYKNAGHDIAIVYVTNGEVGSNCLSTKEIAEVRKKEAQQSASIIGAEFFWLDYPDEFLFNSPETRLTIIETIRQFDPDIIIATDKDNDYHPDHTKTGQLVWDAHVMGAVKNIKTKTKASNKIPDIFFMDTVAGINFSPEVYIDITDYWDTKEMMIRCHKSQLDFCQELYGASIVGNSKLQSAFRGYQAGCKYAEAFRKPKFYPQKANSTGLIAEDCRSVEVSI